MRAPPQGCSSCYRKGLERSVHDEKNAILNNVLLLGELMKMSYRRSGCAWTSPASALNKIPQESN